MAGSVNKVIIVGNLGADPELRNLPSGQQVANLRVATSDQWTDRASGEKRERTEWHTINVFDQNAVQYAQNHLRAYASAGYLPPCSGGRGNRYTVDVKILDAAGKVLDTQRNVAIGRY